MAGTYRQAQPRFRSSQAGLRRQRTVRHAAIVAVLGAAAVLVAACGSSGGSASPGASPKAASNGTPAAVSARQLSGIGTVLVTSSGMTIYTPKTPAELNGNIKCTGSCLSFWLPVTASSASQHAAGLPGKLGTVHLSDGTTQLTYNGRPLYTFRLDTAAGQAHGNNYTDHFNGTTFTWEVVTASGKAAAATAPAPVPSYNNQGGY